MLATRIFRSSNVLAVICRRNPRAQICGCKGGNTRLYNINAVRSESAAPDMSTPDTERRHAQPKIALPEPLAFRGNSTRPAGPNVKVLDCLPVTSHPGLLSSAGKARSPGGLNTVLENYSEQPADERIPLHAGLPHPDAFPFAQLSVKLKSGPTLTIENQDLVS